VRQGLSRQRTELALKMAAPYLAVGVFWLVFHNGWLAILAYHAQILLWARGRWPVFEEPRWTPLAFAALPSVLAGPLTFFLLPHLTAVSVPVWLAANGVAGPGLTAMVLYYGLVHPVLEQVHWTPLREVTPWAHVAFAGYHVLVLWSLLPVPWVALCFAVLVGASWMWQRITRESGSIVPAIAAHVVADLGMVVAAWLLAQ
jgi:hypothetical protein